VNQLTLSKGNLTELEKGCALFGNELLRKTITDTIKICQDISQNYLWVDGLCILQEGEEVRYNHIGLMDAVCNLAFLTIVTASVDDATSGLPSFNALRLSPNCSLHVETISYNNFISSLSSKIAAEAIAELKRPLIGGLFKSMYFQRERWCSPENMFSFAVKKHSGLKTLD
jgi:hypothetical protein